MAMTIGGDLREAKHRRAGGRGWRGDQDGPLAVPAEPTDIARGQRLCWLEESKWRTEV